LPSSTTSVSPPAGPKRATPSSPPPLAGALCSFPRRLHYWPSQRGWKGPAALRRGEVKEEDEGAALALSLARSFVRYPDDVDEEENGGTVDDETTTLGLAKSMDPIGPSERYNPLSPPVCGGAERRDMRFPLLPFLLNFIFREGK